MEASLRFSWIDSIHDCDAQLWQACLASKQISYPFIQYPFLAALEDSGSCSAENGWQAHHLLVFWGDKLIALMPCYEKQHSYGEYVFDQQWANAYHHNGLDYYPKLINAIPFTPCAGPRLVIHQQIEMPFSEEELRQAITAELMQHCQAHYSSFHGLFPQEKEKEQSQYFPGFAKRSGVQFHWYNQGYQSFDDFLSRFSSRKRKTLKKERRQVIEQGFSLSMIEGPDINEALWQHFYHFYQLTYAKRSGHGGYLSQAFFKQVLKTMPEQIVLACAKHKDKVVAAALYFKDEHTLYGRYWGAYAEFDFLHFEACYYQGIDYCIKHGLQHIDAGAQGEHKIQRGFEPIFTYSRHYLSHSGFNQAVHSFVKEEQPHIQDYQQACRAKLPFKQAE